MKKIKKTIPREEITISATKGNKFTKIHLDLGGDGITLAAVGAASALKSSRNTHSITIKPTKNGITLAAVGAASAVKK